MAFSRIAFTPAAAKVACPTCGRPLTYSRTCLAAQLVCQACGSSFDPALFVDRLDEDFEEAYANVPLNRM